MEPPYYTPVIIGVGDVVNRLTTLSETIEPLDIIFQAIELALHDTGISDRHRQQLRSEIDSLDIVRTWTWPYPDLPTLLAARLGVRPRHKSYSGNGGNQPARIFDDAARRVARGEAKVAIVAGGEALASLTAYAKAGRLPPPDWTKVEQSVDSIFSPTTQEFPEGHGAVHSIGAPIQVYPLYEHGFRAHRKQSLLDNNRESARLYADFAKAAEQNMYSWNYGKSAKTAEEIGTVSKRNRMICSPYPLLMNAFNTVDLAAACLLTSTQYAEELGVPRLWERPNYHSCPALSASIDAALVASGLKKEEIDLFDFYSCFPIVPKLACAHLDLPITGGKKPITLLGGLTSFGGAGNNYALHAITTTTRALRSGKGTTALVLANGGCLTYQHAVCFSTTAPHETRRYPEKNPLQAVLVSKDVPPVIDGEEEVEGEAVIETYTIDYSRANTAVLGHIVCRSVKSGHRFLANHGDEDTLRRLASGVEDPIGRRVVVFGDEKMKGRRLVVFREQGARL